MSNWICRVVLSNVVVWQSQCIDCSDGVARVQASSASLAKYRLDCSIRARWPDCRAQAVHDLVCRVCRLRTGRRPMDNEAGRRGATVRDEHEHHPRSGGDGETAIVLGPDNSCIDAQLHYGWRLQNSDHHNWQRPTSR